MNQLKVNQMVLKAIEIFQDKSEKTAEIMLLMNKRIDVLQKALLELDDKFINLEEK